MVVGLASIAAFGLVACGLTPSPVSTCSPDAPGCYEVSVAVAGPSRWQAPADYALELGNSTWSIEREFGGGVASAKTTVVISCAAAAAIRLHHACRVRRATGLKMDHSI